MYDFIKFYLILLNFKKIFKKISDKKFKIKKEFKTKIKKKLRQKFFFKIKKFCKFKKFQERHVQLPIKKFVF